MKNINLVVLHIIVISTVFISCKDKKPAKGVLNLSEISKIDDSTKNSGFYLKNIGEKELIIYKSTSSCGCTLVDIGNDFKINANDSVYIPLKIEPKKLTDTKIKKICITLKTNSADTAFLGFHFNH